MPKAIVQKNLAVLRERVKIASLGGLAGVELHQGA